MKIVVILLLGLSFLFAENDYDCNFVTLNLIDYQDYQDRVIQAYRDKEEAKREAEKEIV